MMRCVFHDHATSVDLAQSTATALKSDAEGYRPVASSWWLKPLPCRSGNVNSSSCESLLLPPSSAHAKVAPNAHKVEGAVDESYNNDLEGKLARVLAAEHVIWEGDWQSSMILRHKGIRLSDTWYGKKLAFRPITNPLR
jgi:hypothetical protein